jgi:hypothetical protein
VKGLVRYAAALVIAIVLGIGSAVGLINLIGSASAVKNGPWRTDLTAGSHAGNIYSRALVAMRGLLALSKSETIYFTAFTDDHGHRLRDKCSYIIEGRPLAARWWSITLYGQDNFLVPNQINRYSYSITTVRWNPDGTYTIRVSPEAREGNWLPSSGGRHFTLTIRLYNPDPSVYEYPESTPLPRIVKENCP